MFSKLSPSGRYVATTIKDRVVSENFGFSPNGIPFSQLFFLINGVIAIYDRQTGEINELPGANLEEFVPSNAYWTPDEKILFFRDRKHVLIIPELTIIFCWRTGDHTGFCRQEKGI
jgi:hypothetical protein